MMETNRKKMMDQAQKRLEDLEKMKEEEEQARAKR